MIWKIWRLPISLAKTDKWDRRAPQQQEERPNIYNKTEASQDQAPPYQPKEIQNKTQFQMKYFVHKWIITSLAWELASMTLMMISIWRMMMWTRHKFIRWVRRITFRRAITIGFPWRKFKIQMLTKVSLIRRKRGRSSWDKLRANQSCEQSHRWALLKTPRLGSARWACSSLEARKCLQKIKKWIKRIKARITWRVNNWIPHQSAKFHHINRLRTIKNQ